MARQMEMNDAAKTITDDQIIGVLRADESSVKTADLFRKHGIGDATFCSWQSKYGGLMVSDAARFRARDLG
ncbi:transposase [Sphingomonas echinoides]|uniref:transposase n=1 Tax=Sphingomonas echinoides TaxID=59803 RepID=UPI003D69C49F